jgi:hypothetical protein
MEEQEMFKTWDGYGFNILPKTRAHHVAFLTTGGEFSVRSAKHYCTMQRTYALPDSEVTTELLTQSDIAAIIQYISSPRKIEVTSFRSSPRVHHNSSKRRHLSAGDLG